MSTDIDMDGDAWGIHVVSATLVTSPSPGVPALSVKNISLYRIALAWVGFVPAAPGTGAAFALQIDRSNEDVAGAGGAPLAIGVNGMFGSSGLTVNPPLQIAAHTALQTLAGVNGSVRLAGNLKDYLVHTGIVMRPGELVAVRGVALMDGTLSMGFKSVRPL